MALYNRLRVIAMNSARYRRDVTAARAEFDSTFIAVGASYGGYCIEQGSIRHFYLLTDPSDEQLAALVKISRSVPLAMIREYKDMDPMSYDIEAIVQDVARVLREEMLSAGRNSMDLARCWSGVRVLESLARAS